MRTFFRLGLVHVVSMTGLLWAGGCTNSQDPSSTPANDGQAIFDGAVDPSGSTFLLQRIEQTTPPDIAPVYVELIGSNLRVDPETQLVELDVAVYNPSRVSLYPPAWIWVGSFNPSTVSVINADIGIDSALASTVPLTDGFDYSGLLGEDGVLAPGETSQAKTWRFHDPGLVPFSFAARAEFSLIPDRARISGIVFFDENANGIYDSEDRPWPRSHLTLVGPGFMEQSTFSQDDGRYSFHVGDPGLYRVTVHPEFMAISPVGCFTTPNPLEVLLTPGPDGNPHSFDDAHFGYFFGPCPQPFGRVIMTDRHPDEIEQDMYELVESKLEGDVLWLHIAFSGCQPEHPAELYISRQFMESEPVQTWALLAHDDLGEVCRAVFDRWVAFDLEPLRREYQEAYGHPGEVILRFRDFFGEEHRFLFGP